MSDQIPCLPTSSIPGIVWPALPGAMAADMLSIQYQLEESQWWNIEKIREHQYRQLQPLLAHAYETTGYYKTALDKIGYVTNEKITPEKWRTIPVLPRSHIQSFPDTLTSHKQLKQHGPVSEIQTSGSTGRPIKVKRTELNNLFWRAFTLREHLWHGRDFKGTLAIIRATKKNVGRPPNGEHMEGWGPSTNIMFPTGPSAILSIASNIEDQANWLMNLNPDYLLTYASNAKVLAQYFIDTKQKLPNLREVRTISEAVDDDMRVLINNAWQAPLTDIYSANEVGYMALQCPDHKHYHIQAENLLLEILDKNGDECKPGEIGRVVITDLHNYAMPLIRYEIGDYAEVGGPCPCGRGLPVIKRILGRSRNMVILPDGTRFWPRFSYKKLWNIAPIQQIQLTQHNLETVEVKLACPEKMTATQESQFTALIQESIGHPFQITISYVDHIARSKGGKHEDFVSKVKQ
ncbi:MAG: phenylacetate--CoA ligase family protein [Gammaproteobacteria bacterium]|nr:phenylacetate--CoA ligase family protein [Gammaproteobacteria bacterium]